MQTTYDFLGALGLDEAALERDIRRAYARRLKQIDQEREAAAFQALRDAYEVALDWARWKLAQENLARPADSATADAPPADAATDGATPATTLPRAAAPEPAAPPEPAGAAQLGATVYHRFLAAAGELVALPKHGEVAAWRAAIEARFGDDELVNIDARIHFEAYIAALLASGWRPGHELLFVAAQEAFGWADDRRGLRQLGRAGRMLDQAIEERRLFEAQEATARARMRDLIKMLRQQELPATRRIRAALPDVERMLGRFPAFTAVLADMENVERWRSAYRESGGAPIAEDIAEPSPEPVAPKRNFTTLQGTVLVLVLFAVLRALFNHSGGEQAAGSGGFIPPGTQQQLQRKLQQQQWVQAVPQAVLDKLVPPVRYSPPPGITPDKLDVVYKVFLNPDNTVERVQNWQTSGEPAFDKAVGDALRAAKAFPPGTPREFEVLYTGAMVREGAPPASAQPPARMAPPVPAPLTLETLRRHFPPVQFRPSPGIRTGDYDGIYKVALDDAGKVVDVSVVKSTGLAALDRAVVKAVRKARPFAPGTRGFQFTYGTTIVHQPAAPAVQPPEESQEPGPVEPKTAPEPAE